MLQSNSPIRRVEQLTVERQGDWVVIEAAANAFLHHMMRNIAGLLIEVGRGRGAAILGAGGAGGPGSDPGSPYGARGLSCTFWDVRYPDAFNLPGAPPSPAGGRASDPLSSRD